MLKKGLYIQFDNSDHKRKERIFRVTKGDVNEIKTKCDLGITREYTIKYIENQINKGNISLHKS